jgi:hypothetical protein
MASRRCIFHLTLAYVPEAQADQIVRAFIAQAITQGIRVLAAGIKV